jgi:3-dehydroquinate dehydratase/shikimate dehydrogenase
MLFATITANNCSDAKQKIHEAQSFPINGIELRLDYFAKIDLDEIKKLRQEISIPMIFTLRKKSQGGFYKHSEEKRQILIKQLISLKPNYFDLEYDVPHDFIKEIHHQSPHTKLICSYHDFNETPKDLSKILDNIEQNEFSIYKIATKANSSLDALCMLNFINEKSKELTISGMCMGELGMPTRILAPIVNSEINYASLKKEEETAPGQLDLSALFDIYNYNKINANTHIYALLGDPVDRSQSHIFHNKTFKESKKNAVYIKIKLSAAELKNFFRSIKNLPFKGFSVTMPLKEAVISYLDELDPDAANIKAINTIIVKDRKLIGFNTDSIGALNAIEEKTAVRDKKIVIVGAGGTAKAIAYESIKRGGTVIILNRTVKRAEDLAKQLNCTGFGLDYADEIAKQGYDILVNTTSLGMEGQKQELPIPEQTILSKCVVLDMVSKPKETPFMKVAQSKNCICIYGEEVFVKQAIEQQHIWSSTLNKSA